jgi:hypothetical protein
MATEFTTWTALYKAMLDQIASGSLTVKSHALNTGTTIRNIEYQSLDDIRSNLEWVKLMADTEAGAWSPRVRTYNVRHR